MRTTHKIINGDSRQMNLIIRLIGVKEKKNSNGSAKQFLYDKTKGQKVFLKFDHQKYDEKNNLMCYLYLKNKTFLNAHLIKEGLADPDLSMNYKYKEKFLNLKSEWQKNGF